MTMLGQRYFNALLSLMAWVLVLTALAACGENSTALGAAAGATAAPTQQPSTAPTYPTTPTPQPSVSLLITTAAPQKTVNPMITTAAPQQTVHPMITSGTVQGKVQPPTALIDKVWSLQTYKDGAAQKAAPVKYSVEFKANGERSGALDCNSYAGTYTVGNNNTITYGESRMTAMACVNSPGAKAGYGFIAQDFTTYEISGDTLNLKNKNGEIVLAFTAK